MAIHLTASVGWIGAVIAYLTLAFRPLTTSRILDLRSAWIAMALIGWWALVPLALGSLVTGVALSLGTKWGLLRHYWVCFSFVGTIVLTGVLIAHMPTVDRLAQTARTATADQVFALPADLAHPLVGLALLIGILILNVYKPKGLTRRGWRTSTRAEVPQR
ncbi:DUF2269 domain-containing protein [Microbacterium mangrovi]|uniref:DUF2269 domain-containing protein n=1 Tax=Microbacterium mangrovi TaxID=1348253 RepID=UPI000ADE6EA5|nr:DUF2269 domain-containing protein [Microbacterium mangrovi]